MKKIIVLLIVSTSIFAAEIPKPKSKVSSVQVTLPPMQILDIPVREFLAQLQILITDGEFLPGKFEDDLKKKLSDKVASPLLAQATEFRLKKLRDKITYIAATSKSQSDSYKKEIALRKEWGSQAHPLMTLYYTIYYQAEALDAKTVKGLAKPESMQELMGIEPEVTTLSDREFLLYLGDLLMHGHLPENDAHQKLFVTELTQKLGAKETAHLLKQAEEFHTTSSKYRVIQPAPLFDEEPEALSPEEVEKLEKLQQIRKDWAKTAAPLITLYYTLYYTYKEQHPERDYEIQKPDSLRTWLMGE